MRPHQTTGLYLPVFEEDRIHRDHISALPR